MGGWVWWLSCFFRQVSEILSTSISLSVNGNDNHNTGDLVVKNLSAYAGDTRDRGSVPGLARSSGGGNGNPLQYSCLENPMDREAWWAIAHGVTKSQIQLSDWAHKQKTQKIIIITD